MTPSQASSCDAFPARHDVDRRLRSHLQACVLMHVQPNRDDIRYSRPPSLEMLSENRVVPRFRPFYASLQSAPYLITDPLAVLEKYRASLSIAVRALISPLQEVAAAHDAYASLSCAPPEWSRSFLIH